MTGPEDCDPVNEPIDRDEYEKAMSEPPHYANVDEAMAHAKENGLVRESPASKPFEGAPAWYPPAWYPLPPIDRDLKPGTMRSEGSKLWCWDGAGWIAVQPEGLLKRQEPNLREFAGWFRKFSDARPPGLFSPWVFGPEHLEQFFADWDKEHACQPTE
jgi:hypothetical protein